MKLKSLLASAAIAAITAMTATAQGAEVELTLSHWVPGTHPLQPGGMEPWAESIKEASNGRIDKRRNSPNSCLAGLVGLL